VLLSCARSWFYNIVQFCKLNFDMIIFMLWKLHFILSTYGDSIYQFFSDLNLSIETINFNNKKGYDSRLHIDFYKNPMH